MNITSLISDGINQFDNSLYSDSFNTFSKIETETKDYKRIIAAHNKVISSFYANGCKNPHNLIKQLREIIDKIKNETNEHNDGSFSTVALRIALLLFRYNYAVALFQDHCFNDSMDIVNDLINTNPTSIDIQLQLNLLLYSLIIRSSEYCLLDDERNGITNELTRIMSTIEMKMGESAFLRYRQLILHAKYCELNHDLDAVKEALKTAADLYEKEMKNEKCEMSILVHALPKNVPIQLFVLYGKAKLSYLKSNYVHCITSLENCLKSGLPSHFIYNGLGLVHFLNNKFSLGLYFFDKAIKTLEIKQYNHEIFYNMGLCYLFDEQPQNAYFCLLQCGNGYIKRPRYWIRLAECCIKSYEMKLDKKDISLIKNIVESENCLRFYLDCDNKEVSEETTMSLLSATQYLRNAYFLLKQNFVKSDPIPQDILHLFYIILSKLSYVYTVMNDPQSSFTYLTEAWKLQLTLDEKRPLISLFIKNYISLNKLQDAMTFLQTIKVEDYNTGSNLEIYVNLANLFLYSRQLDNARFYLKMVFAKDPQYLPALRCYIYLLLSESKPLDAVTIVKTHTIET